MQEVHFIMRKGQTVGKIIYSPNNRYQKVLKAKMDRIEGKRGNSRIIVARSVWLHGWVLICEPWGHGLIPCSGHMPRLRAWYPVGGMQEAANKRFSLVIVVSISPSLFFSEINKKYIKIAHSLSSRNGRISRSLFRHIKKYSTFCAPVWSICSQYPSSNYDNDRK